MPALFDVPGWSVPSPPVSTQRKSKKRKRAVSSEEQELLRSAQANLDKLVDSLGGGGDALSGGTGERAPKKKKKAKANKPTSQPSHSNQRQDDLLSPGKSRSRAKTSAPPEDLLTTSNKPDLPRKKAGKKSTKRVVQPVNTEQPATVRDDVGLTPLQQSFRDSLDGARFRLLNEMFYKSSSLDVVKTMKEDRKTFEDYHIGFRRQVQSWPSNPVSYYISKLSSYPPKTVIADLGCGDAALARALLAKNFTVLSFDLVSDGAYVTEADICSRVPLPGSEPQSEGSIQGEGQIVDVVVCALSLMSTNWPKCIREAWRILRPGGKLMVAEVTSRFANVNDFISLMSSIGFKLETKDDRNSHFMLFQFDKIARSVISERKWEGLMSRGRVLKSCEYKRR